MITPPSKRRKRREAEKLNLTSIMDAIFIFIFFLLMSANFIKVFEIGSPIPIVSDQEVKDDKKPLALTLNVNEMGIEITTGVPANILKKIGKNQGGDYDLVDLHASLINIKEQNPTESTVILNPEIDLAYEELIEIMDSIRMLDKTDEAIFTKGKDGVDVKIETLFDNIIFGNIGS